MQQEVCVLMYFGYTKILLLLTFSLIFKKYIHIKESRRNFQIDPFNYKCIQSLRVCFHFILMAGYSSFYNFNFDRSNLRMQNSCSSWSIAISTFPVTEIRNHIMVITEIKIFFFLTIKILLEFIC